MAPDMKTDEIIVVNLSGRGDKDIFIIAEALDDPDWKQYCRDYAEGKL